MFTIPTHNDEFIRLEVAERRARLQHEVQASRRFEARLLLHLRWRRRRRRERSVHQLAERYA
jgi:hypothetical protein